MRRVRAEDAVADVAVADHKHSNNEHDYAEGTGPALQKEPQNVQHDHKKLILQH